MAAPTIAGVVGSNDHASKCQAWPAGVTGGDLVFVFVSGCNGGFVAPTMLPATDCTNTTFKWNVVGQDQDTSLDGYLMMTPIHGDECLCDTITLETRSHNRAANIYGRISGAGIDWDGLLECCCLWPVYAYTATNCWTLTNLSCCVLTHDVAAVATGCTARDVLFLLGTSGGGSTSDDLGSCCPSCVPTGYTRQLIQINDSTFDQNAILFTKAATCFTGSEDPAAMTFSPCFGPGVPVLSALFAVRAVDASICFPTRCLCCAPTIASVATGTSGGAACCDTNCYSATAPSGITAGDLLILAAFRCTNAGPICTPCGWSLLATEDNVRLDYDIFWKKATAGDACTAVTLHSTCCTTDAWTHIYYRITGGNACTAPTLTSAGWTGTYWPTSCTVTIPCGGCCQQNLFISIMMTDSVGSSNFHLGPPLGYTVLNGSRIVNRLSDAVGSAFKKYQRNASKPSHWTQWNNAGGWVVNLGIKQGPTGPSITSLCPTSGPKGTTVQITGTGLAGADQVRFGGKVAAFDVCPCNCCIICATAPNQGNGLVDVFVRIGASQAENCDDCNNNFTYTGGSDDSSSGGGSRRNGGGNNPGKGGGSGGAAGGGNNNPELFVASKPGTTDTKVANVSFSGNNAQQIVIRPFDISFGIRVLGIDASFQGNTANGVEFYFGQGCDITTNTGKEVAEFRNGACNPRVFTRRWPVSAGPKGLPGEPLSLKGTADVNEVISATIFYQEEPYWD